MMYWIFVLLFSATINAQNPQNTFEQNEENTLVFSNVTYTLNESATTSAGVYKGELLLRTLWNNKNEESGTHPVTWNGLDDEGQKMPAGTYNIKIVSNNVSYEWEGAKIGNTSKNLTGANRYHGLSGFFKFIVVDNRIYWSNGYNEQRTASYTSSISNPQITTPVLDKGAIVKYICADNNFIYWSGHDVHANTSFVFVTGRDNNQEYKYSNARSLEVTYSRTYISALNIVKDENSYITGLARSGKFLFVARQLQNTIHVLDLATGGTIVQTINSVTAPRELFADNNGSIWIISENDKVSKHVINPDGSIASESLSLSGLEQPLTLGLSPKGTEIVVCDGGNRQQVRFFNSNSGEEGAPFGQPGGYKNGPGVQNDKFYFTDAKTRKFDADIYTPQENHAAISFEYDGSFWVLDSGNNRMMHYDRNLNFIEKIQYTPDWLMMSVDKNNPARLFVDFLEYEIDYTEEDVAYCWKLKNNWGYNIGDTYNNNFGKIREPVTLRNGRTYFLLTEGPNFVTAELSEEGIRPTGQVLAGFDWVWLSDGTLVYVNQAVLGGDVTWEKYELISFDSSANPQFSTGKILAQRKGVNGADPLYRAGAWLSVAFLKEHQLITFDSRPEANGLGAGYHLGLLDTNTSEWLFRTSQATGSSYSGDYPLDGRFDTGNGVLNAGSKAMVFGENIVWGYYGEFWKGGFQTNQYAHYWNNGLLLKVFGTNWTKNPHGLHVDKNGGPVFTPFEGMAGNALTPAIVKHPFNSDVAYLYHPDESWHGGIHRWKISNLKSIREHSVPIEIN